MSLPPLPPITDVDLAIAVYSHRSIRLAGTRNEEYGDADRLAHLGKRAFGLAATYVLLSDETVAVSADAESREAGLVSEANVERWLTGYGLRARLLHSQDAATAELIQTPQESLHYWYTYVGAVFLRGGMAQVQPWVSRLVCPQHDQPVRAAGPPVELPSPPLPGAPASDAGVLSSSILALLNQTAGAKATTIVYQTDASGPPHRPTWVARCYVNGAETGRGSAPSQKKAKEAAALQAWAALGW